MRGVAEVFAQISGRRKIAGHDRVAVGIDGRHDVARGIGNLELVGAQGIAQNHFGIARSGEF